MSEYEKAILALSANPCAETLAKFLEEVTEASDRAADVIKRQRAWLDEERALVDVALHALREGATDADRSDALRQFVAAAERWVNAS